MIHPADRYSDERAATTSKSGHRPGSLYAPLKRIVDVIGAAFALVVLVPVFVVIIVAVRASSPGPALFRQVRLGRNGRPFTMLKFRSMRIGDDDRAHRELIRRELAREPSSEGDSYKLVADDRITPIGRWLRRTSLDELPQLVCVLRGDMSLVGPRPALDWEYELFPEQYRRRLDAVPGITGLWQTQGRSTVGTLEMLEMDLDYLDRRSLRTDLGIIVATVGVLLRGDGAR